MSFLQDRKGVRNMSKNEDWEVIFIPTLIEKIIDKSENYRKMAEKEENPFRKAEFSLYANVLHDIVICYKETLEKIASKK